MLKKKSYQFVISKKKNLFILPIETLLFIFNFYLIFKKNCLKKILTKVFNPSFKVIVLANGPSLFKSINNNKFIRSLKNNQLITLNTFPSKDFFFKLKPSFHCLIDSAFFKNYEFLAKEIKTEIIKTFANLNQTKWNLILFIPSGTKKILEKKIINNNIKFIELSFMNYDFESSLCIRLCSYLELPPPRVNVTVTALYLAILSGNKDIELVGADMTAFKNYDVNQTDNEGYIYSKHFSNSRNNAYHLTHKLINKKSNSMYVRLIRFASCFKWFAYLSIIAKKNNIKLKNKSFYSLIDSIER